MRTPTLQYLYLQKPVTMVVVICIISVLPWIGFGDFSTKGEPREASVAISMLESGNWILPQVYANEFAYKPPLAHWLMAAFSYPQGYVSEFTARLPSALAFIAMIGFILVFFGKRFKFQEAFIATLLLITCFEIHRASMTTRVDMLLTSLVVIGLVQLYRWEEKLELKGLPIVIPILLGAAVLTKGPVGLILPLFVFGTYLLMLRKYNLLVIFKALLYAFISSLFLPMLWYLAAWKQGGDDFFHVVMAENVGRFFNLETPQINYDLGHDKPFYYNLLTLMGGFIPWTIFFVFSLFGLKLSRPTKTIKQLLCEGWQRICHMDRPRLFSLVAIVCILFFYSIPSSKRSVYLMPAYPFIALFLAQYAIYITEYRTRVTRLFAGFLASLTAVACIAITLTMMRLIDPVAIVATYVGKGNLLNQVEYVTTALMDPTALTFFILFVLLLALCTVYYQMSKKINIKILYATIGLAFAINLFSDGIIMNSIRKNSSSKPFATRLLQEYPLTDENIFVVNDLLVYKNMYGLNFYMGNIFHDFEKNTPSEGYFISVEGDLPAIRQQFPNYTFAVLTSSVEEINEVGQKILLTHFTKQ